jgi:Ca2+-binding EF-hand superfamily protein
LCLQAEKQRLQELAEKQAAQARVEKEAKEQRKDDAQLENVLRVLRQVIGSKRRLYGVELTDVNSLFKAIDRDGNKVVSKAELREALKRLGVTGGTGYIYRSCMQAQVSESADLDSPVIGSLGIKKQVVVTKRVQMMDTTQRVTRLQLNPATHWLIPTLALGGWVSQHAKSGKQQFQLVSSTGEIGIDGIVDALDRNGDGEIDYEELKTLLDRKKKVSIPSQTKQTQEEAQSTTRRRRAGGGWHFEALDDAGEPIQTKWTKLLANPKNKLGRSLGGGGGVRGTLTSGQGTSMAWTTARGTYISPSFDPTPRDADRVAVRIRKEKLRPTSAPAGGRSRVQAYRVLRPCKIRQSPQLSSKLLGELDKGQVISTTERSVVSRQDKSTTLRVRFANGWVSVANSKHKALLREQRVVKNLASSGSQQGPPKPVFKYVYETPKPVQQRRRPRVLSLALLWRSSQSKLRQPQPELKTVPEAESEPRPEPGSEPEPEPEPEPELPCILAAASHEAAPYEPSIAIIEAAMQTQLQEGLLKPLELKDLKASISFSPIKLMSTPNTEQQSSGTSRFLAIAGDAYFQEVEGEQWFVAVCASSDYQADKVKACVDAVREVLTATGGVRHQLALTTSVQSKLGKLKTETRERRGVRLHQLRKAVRRTAGAAVCRQAVTASANQHWPWLSELRLRGPRRKISALADSVSKDIVAPSDSQKLALKFGCEGLYKVLRGPCVAQEGPEVSSAEVGKLQLNAQIRVSKVVSLDDRQHLRGRLHKPFTGWITLAEGNLQLIKPAWGAHLRQFKMNDLQKPQAASPPARVSRAGSSREMQRRRRQRRQRRCVELQRSVQQALRIRHLAVGSAFSAIDADGKGTVSVRQLAEGLLELGVNAPTSQPSAVRHHRILATPEERVVEAAQQAQRKSELAALESLLVQSLFGTVYRVEAEVTVTSEPGGHEVGDSMVGRLQAGDEITVWEQTERNGVACLQLAAGHVHASGWVRQCAQDGTVWLREISLASPDTGERLLDRDDLKSWLALEPAEIAAAHSHKILSQPIEPLPGHGIHPRGWYDGC